MMVVVETRKVKETKGGESEKRSNLAREPTNLLQQQQRREQAKDSILLQEVIDKEREGGCSRQNRMYMEEEIPTIDIFSVMWWLP